MRFPARALAAAVLLAASLGLAACASDDTRQGAAAAAAPAAGFGHAADTSYGTIVSVRPVAVQGQTSGAGALGGAAVGAAAGSFVGGSDVRGNILGAIGGAIIGGVAGNAAEARIGQTRTVEIIIREDAGGTISVVQPNEQNFQPGERVVITNGATTRLARGAPPAPGT